jgi:hypothetical protein
VSTVRVLELSIEEGATVGDSTVRVLELSIFDGGYPDVTISGPTWVEAGQPITLTTTVTGGNATGYTWTQTAGPTLMPSTESDTYQALAPKAALGTTVTLQVTVDPGGNTDTRSIDVAGASFLRYFGGEWVPWVEYQGGTATAVFTGYDGGSAGVLSTSLLDGGTAPSTFDLVLDGGSA